jgi:membrane-associated phospholipid phosphatase
MPRPTTLPLRGSGSKGAAAIVAFAVGATLTAFLASSTLGTDIDRAMLHAVGTRVYSGLWNIVQPFNNDLEALIALITIAGCVAAWVQLGLREAVRVGSTVVVSSLIAEALKRLAVVEPAAKLLGQAGPSWPSAHAAGITAVAVALAMAPRSLTKRRFAAVGALAFVLICSLSLVVARTHRPTDILGGSLVACTIAAAGTIALRPSRITSRSGNSCLADVPSDPHCDSRPDYVGAG